MLLQYFYDKHLAQTSYMVGCPEGGVALVIDPARDIAPYLRAAEENDLQITRVAETHIHADFVSGGRELAHETGAMLYLSALGEGDLGYDFPPDDKIHYLCDGETFMVGSVRFDVLHMPGHTPEHLVFQVTDTGADRPIGLFTGDCLFVGDVGRPDLLEEAVKVMGTKESAARQQYANVQRFKEMPDYLQVWPGHGAGSACGKALGSIPSSTIGYEKLISLAFRQPDEDAFVEWLLEDQPETPRYFGQMKHVNRVGAPLLETLEAPALLGEESLEKVLEEDALLIDTRHFQKAAGCHVDGSLNITGAEDEFASWAGWYVDYDKPTYLVAAEEDLPRLVGELRAIGVDDIPGYFTPGVADRYETCIKQITPETADKMRRNGALILDVRSRSERESEHIPGSMFVHMGAVPERMDELPRDKTIITQCGAGNRSQIIASILQAHSFDVMNLDGGIEAWEEAGLPLERGSG